MLRAAHVPATFFVVGSEVARHPDIVQQLVRDGDELGNHTFTHVALSNGPEWQRRLQLELSEAAVVGVTGRYTRLNFDSEDWKRGPIATIVRKASPPGTTGGIVMFHDGGGNRAHTVAAVRELIPRLRSRGFRFVTISELAGLPRSFVEPAASTWERRRGETFGWAVRLAFHLVWMLGLLIGVVGLLVAARVVLVVGLASWHRRRNRHVELTGYLPAVAAVVPAYNEIMGIEAAVRSLASSDYPELEIAVVDDGSDDGTPEAVERLALPRVRVFRKENGGKASALNVGIASTMRLSSRWWTATRWSSPTQSGGLCNRSRTFASALSQATQRWETGKGSSGAGSTSKYVTGFNLDRRMYEVLQCTPTVPGAIGAYRRDVLLEVGGVSDDTVAEDADLTLAIGRTGRRVVYAEDARAWTEAPASLSSLWRQRYRWSYWTMQAVWKHKRAVLTRDPRQRRIGRRALPYMFLFQILLPMVAPLIDLFALYGLLFTNPARVIGYWLAFNAVQIGLAAFAFRMDGESLRPLWALSSYPWPTRAKE